MDLQLTDEQRAIQETVREFVDRRVLPVAQENDINHHLDMGIIEGMAELGLLGAPIPVEYGGAGLDYVCEALICEEIERGESAFRTLISVHVGLNSLSLLRFGTEEQKRTLPRADGQGREARLLRADRAGRRLGRLGDADDGDPPARRHLPPERAEELDLLRHRGRLRARLREDRSRRRPRGISAFIVEREWEGVEARRIPNKLGIWAGSTGELFFSNVQVPAENLVGAEGEGFKIAMHSLDQGRFTVAAGAVGVIRACLEASVKYANERQTFGKQIGKHQFVQDMIADMVLGYETSRLLVMQAADAKDRGVRNTRETSLAKWHATESAFNAANLAIQVHGAYGYSAEYPVERYFRNSRAPIIYEGTTQIHKMMQAEHALGYRKMNG